MNEPGFSYRADELVESGLPAVCHEHPWVSNPPENGPEGSPAPLALYIDALPHSQTDSVLRWWIAGLVTRKRHLFGGLRKKYCANVDAKADTR